MPKKRRYLILGQTRLLTQKFFFCKHQTEKKTCGKTTEKLFLVERVKK